ncbi:unnamed protein product [Peronospora belbahrii]|uniref:Nuf2 DHR10-like domain-containing protein n=1 Tax=Peronospora belbahrii TaxID=622444 RepID=A0AAU9L8P0_9STRA|nr:unnamed protein product [Peronospora belbahrii]CAH0521421.1 unnamed protein product [Peronospora belbahrii]
MTELKDQVEAEMTRYRALQDEVQVLATQRQKYAQQSNENEMDVNEAKSNVNKRLEFITNELDKVNTKIEAKEKEAVGIRTNISNMQMEMQKRAVEAAKGAVAAH